MHILQAKLLYFVDTKKEQALSTALPFMFWYKEIAQRTSTGLQNLRPITDRAGKIDANYRRVSFS